MHTTCSIMKKQIAQNKSLITQWSFSEIIYNVMHAFYY